MKRTTVLAFIAAGATILSLIPAGADPLSQRDMGKVLQQAPKRYLASEAGKKEQLTLTFGPYVIPAGQDSNRLTIDFQLPAGYVTSVSPDLVDAASGRVPTEQEAHIHHAHWFRVTDDPNELYYTDLGGVPRDDIPDFVPQEVVDALPQNAGLSWVFGTGEEKTQGGFELREVLDDSDGNGIPDQRYGMEIDAAERQLLIYMIHNKTAAPMEVFVVLDVDFTHGTANAIEAATGVPMHALKGQLFGQTKDALRDSYPTLVGSNGNRGWNVELDGTAIVAGGHAHPGVYGNFITNQGPNGACSQDFDGDGFPGITILRSRKIDHVPGSWPYSEDFQMGVAKYGWRAPVHKGDAITQYAVYDIDNEASRPWLTGGAARYALPGNYAALGGPKAADLAAVNADTVDGKTHQHYEAMNHMGIYIDPLQTPEAYSSTLVDGCPENFTDAAGINLLGEDSQAVQQRLKPDSAGIDPYFAVGANEGMQNHVWPALDPTCGAFQYASRPVCESGGAAYNAEPGIATDTITISAFKFAPGQNGAPGTLGAPAIVKAGVPLRIVNTDAAMNVRHTLTTCAWPCIGTYVSNYPIQDGLIDTGKLGNVDPIDGGITGDDTVPVYELDTSTMLGFYSYYCRIHPFMRGAMQVVA